VRDATHRREFKFIEALLARRTVHGIACSRFFIHAVEQREHRVLCAATTLFSSEKIMPLLHERRGRYLRLIGRAKSKRTRDVNCSHTNHNINIHSRAINSVKEK